MVDLLSSSRLLRAGFVTFVSILLAEMGDKTQLATLFLSAHSHHLILTFLAAASALVLTSLVGVLAGSWVARVVPPRLIKMAAGIGFLVVGAGMLWQVLEDSLSS
jgi:putative Ca2+/H+ antiporter (TMEM165/GDT1 family)